MIHLIFGARMLTHDLKIVSSHNHQTRTRSYKNYYTVYALSVSRNLIGRWTFFNQSEYLKQALYNFTLTIFFGYRIGPKAFRPGVQSFNTDSLLSEN